MSKVTIALVFTFLLALSGAAEAGSDLYTSPLEPEGDNALDCWIANVGKATRTVRVRVLDYAGAVLYEEEVPLAPGEVSLTSVDAASDPRYCHFTVPGSSKSFRAGAAIFQLGVGNVASTPAH